MGVLFDKEVPVEVSEKNKPFTVFLEKYKMPVIVSSLKVNEQDDAVLDIEFTHDIEAPQNEVGEELGRVIIGILEDSIKNLEKSDLVAETPCQTEE